MIWDGGGKGKWIELIKKICLHSCQSVGDANGRYLMDGPSTIIKNTKQTMQFMDYFKICLLLICEFSIHIIPTNISSCEVHKFNQEYTKKLNTICICCRNRKGKMEGIIHKVNMEKVENLGVVFMPLKWSFRDTHH